MIFWNKTIRRSITFALLGLNFLFAEAQASQKATDQEVKSEKQSRTTPETKSSDEPLDRQVHIDKLLSIIEQQQRLLSDLQKRVIDLEGKLPAGATTSAANLFASTEAKVQMTPEPASLSTPNQKEVSAKPAVPSTQNQAKAQDKPPLLAGWDKAHAVLRSADGRFETNIQGYTQLDFHGYASGNHPPNTFLMRRARFILEGRLEKYFDYRFEGDFADTTSTILRDGYIRVHRIDELQITLGQFRQPFSQEEMRLDNTQDFVERSLVNNLAPSRSPGIMVSGTINKGAFEYQLGAFNGKGLLAQNNNGTPDTALRLRFAPWKNDNNFLAKGLYFGGAFGQGRSFNGQSVRGLSESRSITFFAPETVNGKLYRANGELTWLLGPAAIRVEYDQTNQARANLGANLTNLPGVVAKGYMGQFTYLLTGESKPESTATLPKHSLFDNENGKLGLGAWELKFRYANLQISDGTSRSNRAETFYTGVNWYLNRFVRYLFDLGIERFNDPLRSPKPGDKNYLVVLSRMQFTL
jgi:phosphate-selective porin OprO/OprP